MNVSADSTSIRFELKCYVWWQPLFYVCKPVIVLDGQPQEVQWGRLELPVRPGTHQVSIYFPYGPMPQCGKADVSVEARPGMAPVVAYTPPFLITRPGKIRVGG